MARSELGNRGGLTPFEDLTHDMERMFDSLLGRTVGAALRSNNAEKYVPTLDVAETAEGFEVSIDLPGVKPDDVKVEMHEGKLVVSGQRSGTTETKEKNYHRIERTSGSFYRTVALPNEVDVEKIEANYDHGVLHISLPIVAKQQPRNIQIRTGNH